MSLEEPGLEAAALDGVGLSDMVAVVDGTCLHVALTLIWMSNLLKHFPQ